ncbi:ABC transporter ATP-binding protein [Niastella vici]|uniref:ABC transporter ATP-binding protein n=1 Tax=Niastella vici TaxID=1703345 RepID=A0A1V9FYI1_9BACT|nr:peptidase domain-containing ABC transporter [Niastella vici]OQP63425.1 ABC transporter ATP-binding protein [Niastella vici]
MQFYPNTFPFFKQLDAKDCGPTCIRMIARFYKKDYPLSYIRDLCNIGKEGVSVLGINNAAEQLGFNSVALKASFSVLEKQIQLPCIAHWKQNHFVVVYKITQKHVYIADPEQGKQKLNRQEFLNGWASGKEHGEDFGILIVLEPTTVFYEKDLETPKTSQIKTGYRYLLVHFKQHRKPLINLAIGLLVSTLLQLTFPFLTQSIVDTGIGNLDINFVYLILIGQIVIFIAETIISLVQSWTLLYVGTRVNTSIISDFLKKLMRKPLRFFDTRVSGDLLQRIDDHKRIEDFLTNGTFRFILSIFTFLVFTCLLIYYSPLIFAVFVTGGILFLGWISYFQRKRKQLDYKRFSELANNKSKLVEIINGMHDIKLQNAERHKRWEWQAIQARLFRVNVQYLTLEQFQRVGAQSINTLKNIATTFICSSLVISNKMSLGEMLAVQFIVGELNVPLFNLLEFLNAYQDARISIERIGEIHAGDPEQAGATPPIATDEYLVNDSIIIRNLSFKYGGTHYFNVLNNISITIPKGKVTAIVGLSGSGKTTLLKLLLKFYEPSNGSILIGNLNLNTINEDFWRSKCGVVLQDGYIFSDTIAKNITLGFDDIDKKRLLHAVSVANIKDFIETLPLRYNTKIGSDGMGLSQGQKQRMLIARAVYKNPEYIFFDEATNALDANNERTIIENLQNFFRNKTVVIVAHRLSTVKNADQILVMESGRIIEAGNHHELISVKGSYFNLVKNQLELGV